VGEKRKTRGERNEQWIKTIFEPFVVDNFVVEGLEALQLLGPVPPSPQIGIRFGVPTARGVPRRRGSIDTTVRQRVPIQFPHRHKRYKRPLAAIFFSFSFFKSSPVLLMTSIKVPQSRTLGAHACIKGGKRVNPVVGWIPTNISTHGAPRRLPPAAGGREEAGASPPPSPKAGLLKLLLWPRRVECAQRPFLVCTLLGVRL